MWESNDRLFSKLSLTKLVEFVMGLIELPNLTFTVASD
jgi:hypothetical protein